MPTKNQEAYRAYMSAYMRERYRQRKEALIAFLGGTCYACGTSGDLEFDHVRRDLKRLTVSQILSAAPLWRVYQEIMACQLLCPPCHATKTQAEASVGHGEGATGKRNCYCDLCKPLKQRYNRNRKVRLAIEETIRGT